MIKVYGYRGASGGGKFLSEEYNHEFIDLRILVIRVWPSPCALLAKKRIASIAESFFLKCCTAMQFLSEVRWKSIAGRPTWEIPNVYL